MTEKKFDLVCLGRAGVDFYAQQVGSRLEDVASFSKYIGGSSTNIACCSSRMGLATALITRVGNEHMGQFIREQLQREGVDTTCVTTDPDRLTALVVLGIKDKDTFPLIFYRENCADMAISEQDINAGFIASSKALLITGTHLSTEHILHTSTVALQAARKASVKTVLDIDYRPVLWGLTSAGDGETRFIASDNVTGHLQSVLSMFDLVVGTEEEIHIAGGSTNTLQALKNIRAVTNAVLVLKRGPYGASVYDGDIPASLDDGVTVKGVTVDVLNVLGAGDAFISGFLRGWLNGEGYAQALTYANACGALVVSRHGCTPAMPTAPELDYFLQHSDKIKRPDQDEHLTYLHRVTTWPVAPAEICVFDQCSELQGDRAAGLNQLLNTAATNVIKTKQLKAAGVVSNDQEILNLHTGSGMWLARPIAFSASADQPGIGSQLKSWPTEQVVKFVLRCDEQDTEVLSLRLAAVVEVYLSCCDSGHQFQLELSAGDALPAVVEQLLSLNVRPDWWVVPCCEAQTVQAICRLISAATPYCFGVLLRSVDTQFSNTAEVLGSHPLVKGVVTDSGISTSQWLEGKIDNNTLIAQAEAHFGSVVDVWRSRLVK